MPEIKTSVELSETWPKIIPHKRIYGQIHNSIIYSLVVDGNGTEFLIKLFTKHDFDVSKQTNIRTEETFEIVRALHCVHANKSNKEYNHYTYSLRANLKSGRYKIIVTLFDYNRINKSGSCSEYFKNGGDEFVLRLAASENCSIEKFERYFEN